MLVRNAPTTASSQPKPAVRRRKTSLKQKLTPYAFISPTGILLAVLMLIPIVMVIRYSLMDNVIVNQNPIFVGFKNYAAILTDTVFHTAVLNTLFFTLVSVAAHLVLGLGFAMLLNSNLLGTATKAVFRVIFVLPWLFTAAIIAILWRLMLDPSGIVNSLLTSFNLIHENVQWLSSPTTALLAVTFINIWAGYPLYMVSLLAGLQGIPDDLYEAATVDGASAVNRFFNVTLPQLRPIIISMAVLDAIWTSQQFALIWLTTGGGPIDATEMLSTYTYKLAFSSYEFSQASAAAVIILVFSMILAFFYVRHQRARD